MKRPLRQRLKAAYKAFMATPRCPTVSPHAPASTCGCEFCKRNAIGKFSMGTISLSTAIIVNTELGVNLREGVQIEFDPETCDDMFDEVQGRLNQLACRVLGNRPSATNLDNVQMLEATIVWAQQRLQEATANT